MDDDDADTATSIQNSIQTQARSLAVAAHKLVSRAVCDSNPITYVYAGTLEEAVAYGFWRGTSLSKKETEWRTVEFDSESRCRQDWQQY